MSSWELLWNDAGRNEAVVGWLIAASVLTFCVTLAVIPWIVLRLPADYFLHQRRHSAASKGVRGQAVHWGMLIAKNLAGAVFLLMGITMLVLPGQGLLTILVGLSLLDFPGKFRLERMIVTRHAVSSGLNWLRRRYGKPPFELSPTDRSRT